MEQIEQKDKKLKKSKKERKISQSAKAHKERPCYDRQNLSISLDRTKGLVHASEIHIDLSMTIYSC